MIKILSLFFLRATLVLIYAQFHLECMYEKISSDTLRWEDNAKLCSSTVTTLSHCTLQTFYRPTGLVSRIICTQVHIKHVWCRPIESLQCAGFLIRLRHLLMNKIKLQTSDLQCSQLFDSVILLLCIFFCLTCDNIVYQRGLFFLFC